MRKIALFLALCLSLSLLGGCAGSGSTTGAPPSSTPEVTPSDAGGSTENNPLFSGDLEDYDFSSSAESGVNAFNLQLLHAQKFSEGLAWVQYEDEADNLVTSVINTDGTICFSLPDGVEPSYMAPFVDGYSFYRVGDSYTSSYEVAIDQDGNEYYRTSNSDDAKSWEHIIGQHDGQYICLVEKNGLEDIEFIFTLMQSDGTQISSCSCGSTSPLWTNSIEAFGEVEYYGEGWYSAGEYYFMGTPHITYFNFDKQRVLIGQERAVGVLAGEFVNGEIPSLTTFYNVDGQCILNTDLEVVREYDFGALINYASDTLLYLEDLESGVYKPGVFEYYDYWGNHICSVTDYPELRKLCGTFYGDYAVICIKGADDDTYVTAIDRQGKIQFEPYDLVVNGDSSEEYVIFRVYDGYIVLMDPTGSYAMMDLNGDIVHSIADDFPNCEIVHIGYYSDGYLIVTYTSGDTEYMSYYPVKEAAAAGDSIYDVGSLSVSAEASGNPNYNPEEYGFMFISDFSIEGKWKSVGDSGFGQAQPGAIVTFDGTNCNFFSPKDTYALYQDGDIYKLDVTSYLFADTLTFTVNTVSEDYIVITSGQTVTTLERVE